MIRVHDLHRHFGGFRAVDGASLSIRTGSITGLMSSTSVTTTGGWKTSVSHLAARFWVRSAALLTRGLPA